MDLFTGVGVALVTLMDDAGGVDAAATGALAAELAERGMQAVLAWPPPGSEDLPGYFAAVAGAAPGLPVLGYHIPWVSSPGIPVSALADLPIAGLKDSAGEPDRLLAEIAHYPGCTYVRSSALLALAGPLGGTGAILAVANAEPELCSAAFAGDAEAQRRLIDVHLAVRAGGVPALKRILAEQRGTVALSRV
jgi:4-hydroxy-tetrahydrodipicolinate synthase